MSSQTSELFLPQTLLLLDYTFVLQVFFKLSLNFINIETFSNAILRTPQLFIKK